LIWASWPVQEDGFTPADESGPPDTADAVDNYRRVLEIVGEWPAK
jgi:hypothetical protein